MSTWIDVDEKLARVIFGDDAINKMVTKPVIPGYLLSDDRCEFKHFDVCYGDCATPVKQNPVTGKWYVTMGHPGFNSDANNAGGYVSHKAALAAIKKYSKR